MIGLYVINMNCPKCGQQLSDGSTFCKFCGCHIENNLNGSKQNKSGFDIQSYSKYIIAVVVVIIVFLGVRTPLGGADKGGFSSGEEAAQAFIKAMYDKDVEAYLNCFPEETREQRRSEIEEQLQVELSGVPMDIYHLDSPYRFLTIPDPWIINFYISDITEMSQEDIEFFKNMYSNMKEQKAVLINVDQINGFVTRGTDFYIGVGKLGNKWYVLEPSSIIWYF